MSKLHRHTRKNVITQFSFAAGFLIKNKAKISKTPNCRQKYKMQISAYFITIVTMSVLTQCVNFV